MCQAFNHDDIRVCGRFVEIAHHALHQLVGPIRGNQPFGFVQRNGKCRPQARRRTDKMCGTLGAGSVGCRLANRFAEGDAHAAIVERTHKPESDGSKPDFGSAGSEVKRVRHWKLGLN